MRSVAKIHVVGFKVHTRRQLVKGLDFSTCSFIAKDCPCPQRSPGSES